ncbi:uncharacterized protein LOC133158174 isoform X1 [Syngnathus typhle]|uniref:uncharacterized protein LOC133158174 isoform X1 n=1 Tax=Syngnathus typhle TaxID=161592 RepID=UPI002A6B079E|nr:uncharacterized protein LOC133158174 isoform X1 [Syngnathus typhle]
MVAGEYIDVLVDSGASADLLDRRAYGALKTKLKLEQSSKRIYPYGTNVPLSLRGKVTTTVSANGRTAQAAFYVVDGDHGSLLGHDTATKLGLIQVQPYKLKIVHKPGGSNSADYVSRHPQTLHTPSITDDVDTGMHVSVIATHAVPKTVHQPLRMSELPQGPWEDVAVDFCGPFPSGDYLLVLMDECSRFPFVEIMPSTSACRLIPVMDKIFSTVGIPKVVRSGNGPPFSSKAFSDFARYLGFHHRKVTPYWPQADTAVERFNRTLTKAIHTATLEGKPWKQELYKFLRDYRATPHHTTNRPPAEVFYGRPISIKLPSISHPPSDDDLRRTDGLRKDKMKKCADERRNASHSVLKEGDVVLIQQRKTGKLVTPFNPNPYKVIAVNGTMVTARRQDHRLTRHRSHFKLLKHKPEVPFTTGGGDNCDDDSVNGQAGDPEHVNLETRRRRPVRVNRRPPQTHH